MATKKCSLRALTILTTCASVLTRLVRGLNLRLTSQTPQVDQFARKYPSHEAALLAS